MDAFQVEKAIEVAWDPRSDQTLKGQAFQFLNDLRLSSEGWSLCFDLAIRKDRPSEVVRHASLDVVNNAIRTNQIGEPQLQVVSSSLLRYIQDVYADRQGEWSGLAPDSVAIQNKITQTMTYLCIAMYERQWQGFFGDIMNLMSVGDSSAKGSTTGTIMYLKILIAIHDEIADVMVPKSLDEQKKDMILKDLIRERDVQNIARTWHEIIARWRTEQETIVEVCLVCIGRWVSWTDISLSVNDTLLALLFENIAPDSSVQDAGRAASKRDIAIETFIEILSKKMGAEDKLQLLEILRLDEAISSMTNSRALAADRYTATYDTDLAENVAKLVNATVTDVVRAIDSTRDSTDVCVRGCGHIKRLLPHCLRFLSDEYDEVCSTVIPCLTELLTLLRKRVKADDPSIREVTVLLPTILDAVIAKVRYDETTIWGDEDTQTDEAEFQDLRKRLHLLQQAVAAIDETMYMTSITNVVVSTFDSYKNKSETIGWRDLEMALYELQLFGDLAMKNGGLYSKTKPISAGADRLIGMMFKLMETDVATSQHPAIQLQYMELCVRYYMFFEANPQYIAKVLEHFVNFVHHDHPKVRLRSWYLLQRFVKHVRPHIGNIAETVTRALADLLPIQAEISEKDGDGRQDDTSSDDGQSASARFTSQLYLYETIGSVSSARAVPMDDQIRLMRSIIAPLSSDIENHLVAAVNSDARARSQIHHLIMALGTLARGFSDWTPAHTGSHASPPAVAVSEEFAKASEVILSALGRLQASFEIREAARFAFSRFIGVLGNQILVQLPRWIDGLLTADSTKDEIALFMRLLDQVIFGFKTEIYEILNQLLTPFLQRVFASIGESATGTDDEIQLAELKREYLAFLHVVLNNDLDSVFVSNLNQSIFGIMINTIEHLARDVNDYPTAKLALSVLSRMVSTWGGPDIVHGPNAAPVNGTGKPKLEGFDQFMMTRFSPLCWAIPSNSGFDVKDAQGRQALGEAAALQRTIYSKSGAPYLTYLRDVELRGMGMDISTIEEYLNAISSMDMRAFQQYFKNLVQRNAQ